MPASRKFNREVLAISSKYRENFSLPVRWTNSDSVVNRASLPPALPG
jgi:hypothetical protein